MDARMNSGGCVLRVKALHGSLKSAEKRLASFILDHPDEVTGMPILILQSRSGASYATIIRFCKKAGFSGYREFKKCLAADIHASRHSSARIPGFPIDTDDSTETIVEKIFNSSMKTLQDTRHFLDIQAVDRAAEYIVKADEVYFIGTGASGVSARFASTRFFRIGIRCDAETDPTLYKIKTSLLTERDVLFAISGSGRSKNVVEASRIALENHVPVISLTDFAVSPLTRASTIHLYTTPRDTTLYLDVDMPLIIGQISIVDAVFFCCCSKMGEKSLRMMNTTKRVADEEKM